MPKPRCVLIVDDDSELVRATSLRLRAAGYDTLAARDGQQGLDTALEKHPDAIVLDVRMPVKDGLSTLSELKGRKHTKNIPVVMLSASIVDEQAALDAGAKYFLRKPCQGRHVVAALQTASALDSAGKQGSHHAPRDGPSVE